MSEHVLIYLRRRYGPYVAAEQNPVLVLDQKFAGCVRLAAKVLATGGDVVKKVRIHIQPAGSGVQMLIMYADVGAYEGCPRMLRDDVLKLLHELFMRRGYRA